MTKSSLQKLNQAAVLDREEPECDVDTDSNSEIRQDPIITAANAFSELVNSDLSEVYLLSTQVTSHAHYDAPHVEQRVAQVYSMTGAQRRNRIQVDYNNDFLGRKPRKVTVFEVTTQFNNMILGEVRTPATVALYARRQAFPQNA